MADRERFLALLAALRDAVAVLRRYADAVSRSSLEADVDTQNMVLFATYRAIQAAIDAGQHAIAERSLPVPASYRDVFNVLASAGLISSDLARRMAGWAGLRNVIAHAYVDIDLRIVADAIYGELGDLEEYHAALVVIATN